MSEKRSRKKPTDLSYRDDDQALASRKGKGERREKKGNGKWDYSKTIRLLYGVALALAVVACVMIGVKTYEDLSSEKSANKLLEAYKGMETAAPSASPDATEVPTAEVDSQIESAATEDSAEIAEEAEDFRHDAENDEQVDETAAYVPPEEPDTSESDALIQEIINAVGDDGVIGTIEIPKTEQEYPIIGKWSYKLLKISICRYKGPGVNEAGNLVLIGHNYKSGAHFGNLKSLEVGDEVFLTSAGDKEKTRYEIYEIVDVAPDAFSALEEFKGDCGLTLMTCTNNGNKRKILRCVQKDAPASASAADTPSGGNA